MDEFGDANDEGPVADSGAATTFRIRPATLADAAAIARLHVITFNETHTRTNSGGPSFEVRDPQWRKALSDPDPRAFVFVIEDGRDDPVGFARGLPHHEDPDYAGLLNKIYILRRYHRLGLGRRLLGHVARRFLEHDISSMLLFGDADSPSNRFYEALGAERLLTESGEFHGGYGWRDLRALTLLCPVE
jgi:GNAT superfamily N-acetyltransferase